MSTCITSESIDQAVIADDTRLMKSAEDVRTENLEAIIRDMAGGSVAELARITGKDPTLISRWRSKNPKTRKVMSHQTAREMEKALKLPMNWMDQDHTATALPDAVPVVAYHPEEPLEDGEIEIPAINVLVGAGNCIHTEPVREERRFRYSTEWLQRYGLRPDKLIRHKVRGTSMEPFISDGSWITVEMGTTQIVDGNVYLLRYGSQISVKFLFRRYDGGLIIRSFNPSEPDVVVPIQDLEHIEVLGRVVESTNMLIKPVK
jgi:phage repressor protein C with HTH and peptisase S24 domain